MMATAKLFQNGQSQAVRLPKEFKFGHPSYPIKGSLQCCRCDHVAQVMICSCDTVTPTNSNKFKV